MEPFNATAHDKEVSLAAELVRWLTDPVNWSGSFGIPARLLEHVEVSALSVVLASIFALPAALYIGHTRRLEFVTVTAANLGRAIPSFAIIALALPITIAVGLGLGFWPTLIALWFLAIPPMLTNAYVGVKDVDRDAVEASRGMGMTELQVLLHTELPLAAPLIVAGIRTSAVQVIATATLGALVGWGGLGRFIVDGFAQRNDAMILGGAVLVALVAVATELSIGAVERRIGARSPGARRRDPLPGLKDV